MTGRAITEEQKMQVLDALKEAWLSPRGKDQRLGQLIENACDVAEYDVRGTRGLCDPFFLEDEPLREALLKIASEEKLYGA